MRNPPWSRDELILALDFYFRHRETPRGEMADEIASLSRLLNRMRGGDVPDQADYRNAKSLSCEVCRAVA